MSKLANLYGMKVTNVDIDSEGLLQFEGGFHLVIYNPFEIFGLPLDEIKSLTNDLIVNVTEEENIITLKFKSNILIKIDMRDEAYSGPEALQLRLSDGTFIIWN